MSHELLIGLRTYLTGSNEDELLLQLKEAKQHFPGAFLLVELCGEKAGAEARKLADKIDHYSKKPLGLTPPFQRTIEFAKDEGFPSCILTDGDNQHKFSEISRTWELDADAIIPNRTNRSLFLSDAPDVDRLTLEEAENAFLRISDNCFLPDPQPGLVLLKNRKAIEATDLSGTGSMIADLVLTAQIFRKGCTILSPDISIREQKSTRVNAELEFEKISQLERYFSLSFKGVIGKIRNDPHKLMPRGDVRSLESLLARYMATTQRRKISKQGPKQRVRKKI